MLDGHLRLEIKNAEMRGGKDGAPRYDWRVSYQVFARKYRPRTFEDVLGQDHVVRTLRNAIAQNRLAHAYLFVGPRGTGKTSTARIFAKALNCPNGPRVDFDPDDEVCVEIEKGISLDVREIDGASNNGVEQVRELREEVKFAPTRCRYKIYYIDEVHMLSTAAFNALLKTLEEPPEHVKFIFATTEAHKVLPTIISRCQRFDLRRIPAGLIAKHLLHIATLEKVALSEKAAYAIAKGAEGGMRDAQSMLDQLVAFCGERIEEQDVLDIFGFTRGETVANLAARILDRDTVGALKELHTQADTGKDLGRLLTDLIQHFRTLLVHQVDPAAAEEDLSPEVADMVRQQSALVQAESLLRVMDGLAEVDARMRWASNKLLHLEIGVIQAVQTLGEVTLSEVIEALGGAPSPDLIARRAAPPVPSRAVVEAPTAERPRPAPVAVAAPAPAPTPAPAPAPVAEPAPLPALFREEPPAPAPVPPLFRDEPPQADRPAPITVAPTPPPVAVPVEVPPAVEPAVPTPAPAPVAEAPAVPPSSAGATPEEQWRQIKERFRIKSPLKADYLDVAALQSCEGKTLRIGMPTSEAGHRDALLYAPVRKSLEEIMSDVIGRPMMLEINLDPSMEPPPMAEPMFTFSDPEPAPAKAPSAPKPEPKAEAKAEAAKPAINEDFYNDPLIQEALVKFKATLVKP
ncbi:DNA polymerase III subunit gamma/tau [Verrucomicrobium sp. BvORR034]|uniref:DNA polymerase III subunit gamma/tau n=1 Tax=Verrucomicrobium sp. BvORR034 TaxID=1396418 RepID=UPI000679601F|nr:DNA polymerase III subunit gamma/tau [Verrucomicrobium sp. BvORR034]